MTTRRVSYNNPGNIDRNPRDNWQGQLGLEVGVAKFRFDTPENGIRALGKLLLAYRGKDGMRRISGSQSARVLPTTSESDRSAGHPDS